MIPVLRVPTPPPDFDFEGLVGKPGRIAQLELAGSPLAPRRSGPKRKHLPDLWTRALPALRRSYGGVCAYLGLYIHRGTGRDTVDHFIPKDGPSGDPSLAYEWTNFRYASLDVNRLKGGDLVLDPFDVRDDWFALNLVDFKVEARPGGGAPTGRRLDRTLAVVNDPLFCDARRWYHDRYYGLKFESSDPDEPMSITTLRHEAPFVAAELTRQGRLRPGDT